MIKTIRKGIANIVQCFTPDPQEYENNRNEGKLIFEAEHNGLRFVIEDDLPGVGSYLYIYKDEYCTHDYLQDDTDACKEMANEDYEVPMDAWIMKEKNENNK